MLDDDVVLARLVWHPADITQDGKLKTTAFDSADLCGDGGRFVSVDHRGEIVKVAVDQRIATYQADGKDVRLGREKALFADFEARRVRQIKTPCGQAAFSVERFPEQGNPAHCGFVPLLKKSGRAHILGLRTELVACIAQIEPYSEVFGATEVEQTD